MGSDEAVRRGEQGGLLLVGDDAGVDETGRQRPGALAGDHDLEIGHEPARMAAAAASEHIETLAWFVDPAEEEQSGGRRSRRASAAVAPKSAQRIPLGITTASRPRCRTTTSRADSETAIPASIFSIAGRSTPPAICMERDRGVAVWKVATTGSSAAHRASSEMLGVIGSWMCSRSNRPARSQRATRAALSGPKFTRATEPL